MVTRRRRRFYPRRKAKKKRKLIAPRLPRKTYKRRIKGVRRISPKFVVRRTLIGGRVSVSSKAVARRPPKRRVSSSTFLSSRPRLGKTIVRKSERKYKAIKKVPRVYGPVRPKAQPKMRDSGRKPTGKKVTSKVTKTARRIRRYVKSKFRRRKK